MRTIIILLMAFLPLTISAQNDLPDQAARVAALRAEAEAKAKAAQEAAIAAKKAAEEAERAAKKAQEEANILSRQAQEKATETPAEVSPLSPTTDASRQKDSWTVPEASKEVRTAAGKTSEKEISKDAPYMAAGAVPVVDGQVVWTEILPIPSALSDDEAYNRIKDYLNALTSGENETEESRVALLNDSEHRVVATMSEWITFSSSFISLDRANMRYVLDASCADGQIRLKMNRINYIYEIQGKEYRYKAENWIVDNAAVNKKRTKLLPISGKFRRATIQRKNEIFKGLKEALQQ